jgi:hypothetical protein
MAEGPGITTERNTRKIDEIVSTVTDTIRQELESGRSIQVIFIVNIAAGGIGDMERYRKDRFTL